VASAAGIFKELQRLLGMPHMRTIARASHEVSDGGHGDV
jgi:hypothetical protein